MNQKNLPKNIIDWDTNHLEIWLTNLFPKDFEKEILQTVQKIFKEEQINGKSLLTLSEMNLKDIGIKTGPRNILITEINKLKQGIFYLIHSEEKNEEKSLKKQKLDNILEWQTFTDKFRHTHIDNNEWKEDEQGTFYANELLNASEIDLSADVQMIKMNVWLQQNEIENPNIFIRKCQREFWKEVLSFLEKKDFNRAIVTGNPGIGKSRSMTYFLRLLLKKGMKIIYESRKDKVAFAFIPGKENFYKVWKTGNFKAQSCVILKNSNNYYLIDPETPNQIVNVSAHTVLCSSPNKDHYKEFYKEKNTYMWCMPVWSREEIKAVKPYFKVENKEMTDDELEIFYNLFGGRIRMIFEREEKKREYLSNINQSIRNLEFWKLITAISKFGIDLDQSNPNNPSLLFNLVENEIVSPPIYMMYNFTTSIASHYIKTLFAARFWKDIMNKLSQDCCLEYIENSTLNDKLFEILAITYLSFETTIIAKDEKNNVDHQLTLKKEKKIEISESWEDFIQFSSTLNPFSKNSKRIVDCTTIRNQPVFDLMDAKDRVYKITVGNEHKINNKEIQKILLDMGATSLNPLTLYHVVLEDKIDKFMWKYDTDFEVDSRVKELELKSVTTLKKELKNLNSELEVEKRLKNISLKKKNSLIQEILKLKDINAETLEDIKKKVDDCFKIYKIFIPKNPPKFVEEIIRKFIEKT